MRGFSALIIRIKSKWPPKLNLNGLPCLHVVADYGGVYCFMFCLYVCIWYISCFTN